MNQGLNSLWFPSPKNEYHVNPSLVLDLFILCLHIGGMKYIGGIGLIQGWYENHLEIGS